MDRDVKPESVVSDAPPPKVWILTIHWSLSPRAGGGYIDSLVSVHPSRDVAMRAARSRCAQSYPLETWKYHENVDSFRYERDCPAGLCRIESGELPVES